MNKELMELLKIDEETAEKVCYEMDCSGIDYSECTKREFNRTARECLELVRISQKIEEVQQSKTQDEARQHAIEWQTKNQNLSYAEIIEWQVVFEELAEKFDLTEEFTKNGII